MRCNFKRRANIWQLLRGKNQVRKIEEEIKEGLGSGLKDGRLWLVRSQEEIKGRRAAQSERYCPRLNVSKTTMMMPSKARGCLAAWLPGCLAASAARCARSQLQAENKRVDDNGR